MPGVTPLATEDFSVLAWETEVTMEVMIRRSERSLRLPGGALPTREFILVIR